MVQGLYARVAVPLPEDRNFIDNFFEVINFVIADIVQIPIGSQMVKKPEYPFRVLVRSYSGDDKQKTLDRSTWLQFHAYAPIISRISFKTLRTFSECDFATGFVIIV